MCVCACAFFGEGFRMAFSLLTLLTITTPMDFKFSIFMDLNHFVNRGGFCFCLPFLGGLAICLVIVHTDREVHGLPTPLYSGVGN